MSCICSDVLQKKKARGANDKCKKRSLLSCCLATKTLDADWQETRDDVSAASLDDNVRIYG